VRIVCPICKTVVDDVPDDYAFRPFCSSRCKTIDLGNWLDEKYRISRPLSADEVPEPSEAEQDEEQQPNSTREPS